MPGPVTADIRVIPAALTFPYRSLTDNLTSTKAFIYIIILLLQVYFLRKTSWQINEVTRLCTNDAVGVELE